MQVLNGLKYIHTELKISISKPLYENTFLNYAGYVKIGANADFSFSFSLGYEAYSYIGRIGTGLLEGPGDRGPQDIRSVGNLMLHIMQQGTMFRNSQEENLQNPRDWSVSLVNFWNATKTSTIEDLLDVSKPSPIALSLHRLLQSASFSYHGTTISCWACTTGVGGR